MYLEYEDHSAVAGGGVKSAKGLFIFSEQRFTIIDACLFDPLLPLVNDKYLFCKYGRPYGLAISTIARKNGFFHACSK